MASATPHKHTVFIVAGESSADQYGAQLLRHLKLLDNNIAAIGIGGKALALEGMEILVRDSALNVFGTFDWWDRAGSVLRSYRTARKFVRTTPIDCAVLIDLPDFNLRLAKHLKAARVPIVYYVSPQVWAWRRNRLHSMKQLVDKMLVIFPFEEKIYRDRGIPVEFVGHPMLDWIVPKETDRDIQAILQGPRIACLPGSRKSEVKYHLPILIEVIEKIKLIHPSAQFRIPVASSLDEQWVQTQLPPNLKAEATAASEILKWADAALVASGTATLETALIQTPFALFYRVNRISAWIFRKFLRYKGFIGIPNLLSQREIVKEFFQEAASQENLTQEINHLLSDPTYRTAVIDQLKTCRQLLGTPGVGERAARAVHSFLLNGSNELHTAS